MSVRETIAETSLEDQRITEGDCVNIAVALERVFGGTFVCSYPDELAFQEQEPAHCAVRIGGVLYDGNGQTSEDALRDRAFNGQGHHANFDDIIVTEVPSPSRKLRNPATIDDLVNRFTATQERLQSAE